MDTVYKIGLDIGSTTIKAVVLSANGKIMFSVYRRHHAKKKKAYRLCCLKYSKKQAMRLSASGLPDR